MTLQEADKTEHKVEDQWHYPILTAYGFEPIDKVKTGLVRSYKYKHKNGDIIEWTTGFNADYWDNRTNNARGYWGDLRPHLEKNYKTN